MKFLVMGRHGIVKEVIPIPMLLALLVLIGHCGASNSALEHKCIHDTKEMQALFYGPVVNNKTGQRHAFTPQGILERTAPQQYRPVPPPDAPDEVHRAFHATAVGNIRIVTSTLDLDDSSKYCTKVGEKVPDFKGGRMVCTEDHIFTAKKKDTLLNKVLPAALGILSSALKVKQVQGNLISKGCKHYTTPEWHRTTGVPNADYVLYLSVGPADEGVVAWAGLCRLDLDDRPVIGRANFEPKYLVWDDDKNVQHELVQTAVHEILHALGFSSFFWTNYFPKGNPVATEKRRGKRVHYFKSKNVVKRARKQFACRTLTGPELEDVEDEYGEITGGSHWKMRSHKDDTMGGIVNRHMFLTPITLAVMEDSGHYTVDWSKAENPKWMYKAGCGVFNKKCKTKGGGLGKYFCNDEQIACTPDRRTIGQCNSDTFRDNPNKGLIFPGKPTKSMDYCPIVVSFIGRECDNPFNSGYNQTIVPQYYATDGRCFKTDGVVRDKSYGRGVIPANCLQTRCVNNVVEFRMPENDTWITCPSEGARVTVLEYGYKGTVICPDPEIICDGVEIERSPRKESGNHQHGWKKQSDTA